MAVWWLCSRSRFTLILPVQNSAAHRESFYAARIFKREEIAKLWPVDDDPDELLRFLLEERRARRQVRRGRN